MIKTRLITYEFYTEEEYDVLANKLRGLGLRCFDAYGVESFEDMDIEFDTEYLFNNQWNTTDGVRVFDWRQYRTRTHMLLKGYYLEQTPEMMEIRMKTKKCGYCGYQAVTKKKWCTKCLGSKYLKESDLHLLELKPIADDSPRCKKPSVTFIKKYKAIQKKERIIRLKRDNERRLKSIKRNIENYKIKYRAFKWLIDHNIDCDNCIYYDHIPEFCFGWRRPIKDVEGLRKQLKGFKWPYRIKEGL